MTSLRETMIERFDGLCVRALFGWRYLWVEMLELAGFDAAAADERIDLALLQANHSPESVRGQLAFVDQSVQRARGQSQRGRCFFGGEPIAVCLSHDNHNNTISSPLSTYRDYQMAPTAFEGARP